MAFRRPVPAAQRVARRVVDGARSVQQLAASVPKTVAPIVAGQVEQVEALLSNYLTTAAAAATYALLGHKHSASDITSGGTIGGSVAVSGNLSASGTLSASSTVSGPTGTFNTGVNSTGAYGNNITSTRVAGWIASTGAFGTASSSERYKTAIEKATLDPTAILATEVDYYQYVAEIAKRDDPSSADYVGPDYKVHVEIGMIAERLHEAGLWPFVRYLRDPVYKLDDNGDQVLDDNGQPLVCGDTLALDDQGQPIPDGIHYELWGLAVHIALQHVWAQTQALQEQVEALQTKVDGLIPPVAS